MNYQNHTNRVDESIHDIYHHMWNTVDPECNTFGIFNGLMELLKFDLPTDGLFLGKKKKIGKNDM